MTKRSAEEVLESPGFKKMKQSEEDVEALLEQQPDSREDEGEVDASTGGEVARSEDINNTKAQLRMDKPHEGLEDMYLDQVERKRLDFDFEKLCSVTMVTNHIYGCLVCGKFFAGRGPKTPLYFHALENNHNVVINLETKKIYALPEGYEVTSKSLNDVKYNLDPIYTPQQVEKIDKDTFDNLVLAQDGKTKFKPGFVGLQDLKNNDWFNCVMQALAHIRPLRNKFLLEKNVGDTEMAKRFGILMRKMWNPKAFKGHVSPHELLQEISLRTDKEYDFTKQSDPFKFLALLLNKLHRGLGGTKDSITSGDTKTNRSIMSDLFQGHLRVEAQDITTKADEKDNLAFENTPVKTTNMRFVTLPVDLPTNSLFEDAIPRADLLDLLKKYNGQVTVAKNDKRMRYRLMHPLPPYLIMYFPRFFQNKHGRPERSRHIVAFTRLGLNMNEFTEPSKTHHPSKKPIYYDMVANITHEAVTLRDDSVAGEETKKVFKVQVVEGEPAKRPVWWALQDMHVESVAEHLLNNAETYIQIWQRREGENLAPGCLNPKLGPQN
ncbi:hypothetical protein MBLNU230_g5880t1 [Neophaeotheca triangularis]